MKPRKRLAQFLVAAAAVAALTAAAVPAYAATSAAAKPVTLAQTDVVTTSAGPTAQPLKFSLVSSATRTIKADAECPANSQLAEQNGTYVAKTFYGVPLFTIGIHANWCFNDVIDGTVTRIVGISVVPDVTEFGSAAGWQYLGQPKGTADGYYFNDSGAPDSGYHIYRDAHWHECVLTKGCFGDRYFGLNMNVFYNGTAKFYMGPDHS